MFRASIKELEEGLFIAKSSDGRVMIIDSREKEFKSGFSPMELLLIAVAGCTAIDMSTILGKMRQRYEDLEVVIEGERRKDYPKIYEEINIKYKLRGRDLDYSKVKRAAELSQEKYCSVGLTVKRGGSKIDYEIEISDE
jgi:putative redox protein